MTKAKVVPQEAEDMINAEVAEAAGLPIEVVAEGLAEEPKAPEAEAKAPVLKETYEDLVMPAEDFKYLCEELLLPVDEVHKLVFIDRTNTRFRLEMYRRGEYFFRAERGS